MLWHTAQAVLIVLLIGTAVLLATKTIESEVGFAILAVFLAAAVVAALTPDVVHLLLSRLQKLAIGPVAFEWLSDAGRAATEARRGSEEDEDGVAGDLIALRLKLEAKLAFIAKHLLGTSERPTYVTIGSLRQDRYVTESQARTASRLLSLTEEQVAALPEDKQRAFLGDANTFVRNVRAQVFHPLVGKRLRSITRERPTEIPRGEGRRPDFLVQVDGRRYRVAPAFAQGADSEVLTRVRERLGGPRGNDPAVDRRLVVIPDLQRNEGIAKEDGEGDPEVVRIGDLERALLRENAHE
jgi:hypothetical protein